MLLSVLLSCLLSVQVNTYIIKPGMNEAEPCNPDVCKLPHCRCSGTDIPGGLSAKDIPQIVMITFDDAINNQNFKFFTELFNDGTKARKNPNGCNVTTTYFVSHEWTIYPQIAKLYHWRHELADHTITHRKPISWWRDANYTEWKNEIGGMREILHKFANIKTTDVKGFRAPYLQVGGNNQFKALHDLEFLYDSSLPTPEVKMWPYTLDYKSTQQCVIGPCPTDSFPGLWVVPMTDYKDLKGQLCAMVDSCPNQPKNEEEAYEFLMNNFLDRYNTNRAPFPMFMHATWLTNFPHGYTAMTKFLDKILSLSDVYIVTVSQALEWVRQPTPMKAIKDFKPWRCDDEPPPLNCDQKVCCYDKNNNLVPPGSPGITHYFHTCYQPCTKRYPWYGNPDGN